MRRRSLLALPALGVGCARPALEATVPPTTVDWARAIPVEVRLVNYAFEPERLSLRVGTPYRLVLVNPTTTPHDFTARTFFRDAATQPDDAVAAAMRAAGGSVDVPREATRVLPVVPLRAGRFDVECIKPFHALFGMTGSIEVVPA